MRDLILLHQLQALPLGAKVLMSQQRIREWYQHFNGKVVISFSGGKDSTVLTHLVRDLYPEVPMVFANTGLEYPEIQAFARKMGAEFVRPKMRFDEVISTYGYPLISKEVAQAIYAARHLYSVAKVKDPRVKDFDGSWKLEHSERTSKRMEFLGKRMSGPGATYKLAEEEYEKTRSGAPIDTESYTGSTFYNKSKWLPMLQETQFQISHYCCDIMKKYPIKQYKKVTGRKNYLGSMAEESKLRESAWVKSGCNTFEGAKQSSKPMSFWTEQDVLRYILENNLEICSVYGSIMATDDGNNLYTPMPGIDCTLKCTGCSRTGCIFCGFGVHLEKGKTTKFQALSVTHPKQYEYCMGGGQWVDNPKYDPTSPEYDGDWKVWNPKKIWVPSKAGLGMRKVFDDLNQLYGKNFIRYE